MKSNYSLLHKSPPSEPVQTEVEARKWFWRRIWKLRVPGKIKHFMWKSCTNSLTTKANLLKCTKTQDPVCHLCANEYETILHALWGCEKVQWIWNNDFSWMDKSKAASGSFIDLISWFKRIHSYFLYLQP